MKGLVNIEDFMAHLEQHDLMIAPRDLVEEELKLKKKRRELLRKPMLTFREIYDGKLWGRDIQQKSIKSYALKYAKPGEIIEVKRGEKPVKKIIIAAVERIAKQRGVWSEIAA